MGNCLPFFHIRNAEDFTRLNNLPSHQSRRDQQQRPQSLGQSRRSSQRSGEASGGSSSSGERSSRRHRNLNASSYVNELYVSSTMASGDEVSAEEKALNEKRKARIRGLLEQLPIDTFVEGGKGDGECAICMVDFDENDPIRFLPCMHSYHVTCIDDWLLRSFTCPSCMEPVDSAILSAFTSGSTNLASLTCSPAANSSSDYSGSK